MAAVDTGFTIKLIEYGHLADGGELQRQVEEYMEPFVYRAAGAVRDGLRSTSPYRTGRLYRGWMPTQFDFNGESLLVEVENDVPYAKRQNEQGRNQGYVERGLEAGQEAAIEQIRQGVAEVAPHLWVGR